MLKRVLSVAFLPVVILGAGSVEAEGAKGQNGCTDASQCCQLTECYDAQCALLVINKTDKGGSGHAAEGQTIRVLPKDSRGNRLGNSRSISAGEELVLELSASGLDTLDRILIGLRHGKVVLQCSALQKIVKTEYHRCRVYLSGTTSEHSGDLHCTGLDGEHNQGPQVR